MSDAHPTAEEMARYLARTAPPGELLSVDAHIAGCDRCHQALAMAGPDDTFVTVGEVPGVEQRDHPTYDERRPGSRVR